MTRCLRKMLCSAMLLVLLISSVAPAYAKSVSVKVFTNGARVYSRPSTSSASLRLPRGLSLSLTGVSHGVARVSYKGRTGYMALSDLITSKRYTAYTNRNTYLFSKASTSSKHVGVGVNTKMYVVGKSGSFWRVQNSKGVTAYVAVGHLSRSKVSTGGSASSNWKSKVVKLNWFNGGKKVLKKGGYGYLYDIKSGAVIRVKCQGGTNHADVEPATKTDTYKLYKIGGNKFSWDSRPCILYANGKFVACAINTMPHGQQTISSNGYSGQFCLHMSGSLTHGTCKVNSNHQAAINAAYNWAH